MSPKPHAFATLALLLCALAPRAQSPALLRTTPPGNMILHEPRAAYDVVTDRYLAVWPERTSIGTGLALGRFLDRFGRPTSATFALGTAATEPGTARAAWVATTGRFVTVFGPGAAPDFTMFAASVDPRTGLVSPQVPISDRVDHLEISGELMRGKDRAVVVYEQNFTVFAREVGLTPRGGITLGPVRPIATNAIRPKIAKTGGVPGRRLVAFLAADFGEAFATVLDDDLRPSSAIRITSGSVRTLGVDGDGNNWVVACVENANRRAVNCYAVSYDAVKDELYLRGDQVTLPTDPELEGDIHVADVAWLSDSALVAYGTPWPAERRVASIDPFTCDTCQTTRALPPARANARMSMATKFDGSISPALSEGLTVYLESGSLTDEIWAVPYFTADGTTKDMWGVCGTSAGLPYATCMVSGRGSYPMQLRGARPFQAVALSVASSASWVGCGTCVLGPDPTTGVSFFSTTNEHGDATIDVSGLVIPAAIGIPLYAQWHIAGGGGCFGTALSKTLEIWIE